MRACVRVDGWGERDGLKAYGKGAVLGNTGDVSFGLCLLPKEEEEEEEWRRREERGERRSTGVCIRIPQGRRENFLSSVS